MSVSGFRSRFSRKPTPAAGATPDLPAGAAALPEPASATPATEDVKAEAKPEVAKSAATGEAAKLPVVETKIAPEAETASETKTESGAKSESGTKSEAARRGARLVEGASKQIGRLPDLGTWKDGLGRAATAVRPAALPADAAIALVLALGVGYGVGSSQRGAGADQDPMRAGWQQATQEVARINAELKTLRSSFDGLKSERDKSRGELQAKQAQLSDKVERVSGENVTRTSRLADQVEKGHRGLLERIEKLERQASGGAPAGGAPVAAAPTLPPKPVAAASAAGSAPEIERTGSIEKKTEQADLRRTKIEGIYVRDIDDGFALIEMKNGGYMDVAVGYTVPGVGRVESIERRGRQWVVVTPKGYIGER